MGSAVHNIASGIKNTVSNPGQSFNNFVNGAVGPMGPAGGFVNQLPGASNWLNQRTGGFASPFAQGGLFNPTIQQPSAPGVDPGVAAMQQQQQQQAQQFRANLPQNEQMMFQNAAQNANRQLGQNLNNINQNSNSRGLMYGGINQGLQAKERANTQVQLAQTRENINDQMNNAANQMDAAAIGTGMAIQQSQQSIQDQIYNQALMNMMNQNQSFGSVLGAGAMIGAMGMR